MIKAYLACISTMYEGEDIEIRYSIFKDEELVQEKTVFADYSKPALCGLISMQKLLKELEQYIKEEIVVVINDGALLEILNGTSGTKKEDVQILGTKVRKALNKFYDIHVENITGNHLEVEKWNEILNR